MPFCENCGATVELSAKFCAECGGKLPERAGSPAPAAHAPPPPGPAPAAQPYAPAPAAGYAAAPAPAAYAPPPPGPAYAPGTAPGYAYAAAPAAPRNRPPAFMPDPADVAANRGMAMISYMLLLIFLPLTQCKNSPYVRFHANRSLVTYVFCFGGGLLLFGIGALTVFVPTVGPILTLICGVLSWGMMMSVSVLCLIGMVQAWQGKARPLPILGGITFIKYMPARKE